VTFTFITDVVFTGANGTPLFTINAGSTLTFPNGSQAGAGCHSDNWTFNGSINGQSAIFSFAGTLAPASASATGGLLRALPALAASDILTLDMSNVTVSAWNVTGLPEPSAPGKVTITTSPTGPTKIETGAGTADISISPTLEVPFTSTTHYTIGAPTTTLATVGSGPQRLSERSRLPLEFVTLLPVLALAFGLRLRGTGKQRMRR
jgi:hypothetical protein